MIIILYKYYLNLKIKSFNNLLFSSYPCDVNSSHIPDIYSSYCWSPEPNLPTGGECGNYKKEGDCFNREHVWPKSWFGGFDYGDNAQTDLFELWFLYSLLFKNHMIKLLHINNNAFFYIY